MQRVCLSVLPSNAADGVAKYMDTSMISSDEKLMHGRQQSLACHAASLTSGLATYIITQLAISRTLLDGGLPAGKLYLSGHAPMNLWGEDKQTTGERDGDDEKSVHIVMGCLHFLSDLIPRWSYPSRRGGGQEEKYPSTILALPTLHPILSGHPSPRPD
ncbi:hypothetical protein H106_02882 [Trichophyton rubrum CBS 735.88]|nr:hypothetical protein H106_02882 [Trichophyton rubrum CBS 735.88]